MTPSVDPVPVLDHDILELPTSNQCEIEFMTIIPLTKNYSQEINTVEQTLKDLIVKNYSNFYWFFQSIIFIFLQQCLKTFN